MARKILLVAVLAGFLVVGVAQGQVNDLPDPGMLPDNPFYFLKSFFEGIGTFFTFGEIPRAERFLHLAEVRLVEARALAEKGKPEIAERAVARHQEQLNRALAQAEQARARGLDADEVLAKVSEATLRHQAVLADVYEKVPEQARPAIERAMEAGMRGHEEALKAVSGEKQEEVRQQMEEAREGVRERFEQLRQRGVPLPVIPIIEEEMTIEEIIPEVPIEIPVEPEPEAEVPEVEEIPEVEVPEVEAPEVEIPEIEMPEVEIPVRPEGLPGIPGR